MMQYPLFNCLNIKPMSPVRRRLNEGEHIVLLQCFERMSSFHMILCKCRREAPCASAGR